MNITSKRLDKIKKTKNQSKRRIHYKNKKNNGKEKNRRKNRKYNKSTGKYRKTHKQKKRAYDLKNKSLKFKENQPVNKPAPLKIITTDKPVETVQTGGGDDDLWMKFKELYKRADLEKQADIKATTESVANGDTQKIEYDPLTKRIVYFNVRASPTDTGVTFPVTSDPTAAVVIGDLKQHVEAAQNVVDGEEVVDESQSGGYEEIYDMMLKYHEDKTAKRWNDGNWVELGNKLATLIEPVANRDKFLDYLNNDVEGEALQVATAMQKVLEKIKGENKMKFGFAYATNNSESEYNLNEKITGAMEGNEMDRFNLKAIIRGTKKFDCNTGPEEHRGKRTIDHYDSFVKIEGGDKYVHFDALSYGTQKEDGSLEIVDIKDYLPVGPSCNVLIFLFNKDNEYPQTGDLKELQVRTAGNGNSRCWINATLYAVLFGIMNKEGTLKEE